MDKLYKAHAEKTLTIDCPNIEIWQRGVDAPISVAGSGVISQSENGGLKLKMFVAETTPGEIQKIEESKKNDLKAGQIIPDHAYFSMAAHAVNGEVWSCESFMPSIQYSLDMRNLVISGGLGQVESKHHLGCEVKGASTSMLFPFLLEYPCNGITKIETIVAGRMSGSSTSVNVATFKCEDIEYIVRRDDEWTVLTINKNSGEFQGNHEVRICEALSFAFDLEFNPAVITSFCPGESRKVLRSYDDTTSQKSSHPPLSGNQPKLDGEVWLIFEKYLKHVASYTKPYWHPLTGHVMSVLRASRASLDAQALSLAVAVEGLLKLKFKGLGKPTSEILGQIERLQHLIEESDLDAGFKKRLEGTISSLKSPRPKDILHELAVTGEIRESLAKTWGILRNAHAHADSQDPEKIAELLKECQIVRTLLNELVFIVIGYEGSYTDYSTEDWPIRRNSRPGLLALPIETR